MISTGCHRTYIFRGKRKSDGAWVYGNLIMAENYCCILEKEEDVHPIDYPYLDGEIGWIDGKATPVISDTVSQYIMGEDRNGQMLFEGDIVRVYTTYFGETLDEPATMIIYNQHTMCEGGLGRKIHPGGYGMELVGNVWNNPELLSERDKKWIESLRIKE